MTLVQKPNLAGAYFSCLGETKDSIPYPFNQLIALRIDSEHHNTKYILKNLIDFEPKVNMDNPMLTRFLIAEFFIGFVVGNCGKEEILSSR